MDNKEKSGFAKTFSIWFGLGALMFGTFCGANMASGVYATGYIITLGGGWGLVWMAIFCAFMSFFCAISLDFVRAYKTGNYNAYYLALYGLNKPDSNPVLKTIVTVFFDLYTMAMGVVTVAATISLFAELFNTLLGVPVVVGSIGAVLLFTVLTIYGAGFLRKFNTLMTIALIVSLFIILGCVISVRGDVLVDRIGNFEVGLDWSTETVGSHLWMIISYCFMMSSWGSTLSNYGDQMRDKRDAIGSGITIGILVTSLFAITSAIVLPFMPEALVSTPILTICQQYFSPIITVVYWIVVILSVVSTAPSFTYAFSNRWVTLWKTEKVDLKLKLFIISLSYLLICWLISSVGLMTIVQKGYTALGKVALPTIVVPLFISIFRVIKKDKADAAAAKADAE